MLSSLQGIKWTNESVLLFAQGEDPVQAIIRDAQRIVMKAMDEGWSGPPFDPLLLAQILKIEVFPRDDVRDARAVPVSAKKSRIEYNPNRPRGRMRYSVAHEIAHTRFPDHSDKVRNRAFREEMEGDEWQLEALCNIAAAEFLMPIGSFESDEQELSIDLLLGHRKRYEVSMEAMLIRAVNISKLPYAMFCASFIEKGRNRNRYRLNYMLGATPITNSIGRLSTLPDGSKIEECNAIGFTAKGNEMWGAKKAHVHVECVGVPPYPGSMHPRVVGLLSLNEDVEVAKNSITYLRGDATDPRGPGRRIIVHVVNDKTPNWGGGFAGALKRKWPEAQKSFREWVEGNRQRLKLGNIHLSEVEEDIFVASLISQKGYGPSRNPRIRYTALREGLEDLAAQSIELHATVHMPRIGAGQARGSWGVIQELVTATLCEIGVDVTVYDLPGTEPPPNEQLPIPFQD